jgi:hypothetical protein
MAADVPADLGAEAAERRARERLQGLDLWVDEGGSWDHNGVVNLQLTRAIWDFRFFRARPPTIRKTQELTKEFLDMHWGERTEAIIAMAIRWPSAWQRVREELLRQRRRARRTFKRLQKQQLRLAVSLHEPDVFTKAAKLRCKLEAAKRSVLALPRDEEFGTFVAPCLGWVGNPAMA